MKNSCFECKHKRSIPGNCHISCANPDPNVKGNPHGIRNGWFFYPFCFDPTWMENKCNNFTPKTENP